MEATPHTVEFAAAGGSSNKEVPERKIDTRVAMYWWKGEGNAATHRYYNDYYVKYRLQECRTLSSSLCASVGLVCSEEQLSAARGSFP